MYSSCSTSLRWLQTNHGASSKPSTMEKWKIYKTYFIEVESVVCYFIHPRYKPTDNNKKSCENKGFEKKKRVSEASEWEVEIYEKGQLKAAWCCDVQTQLNSFAFYGVMRYFIICCSTSSYVDSSNFDFFTLKFELFLCPTGNARAFLSSWLYIHHNQIG
jgi:hypothetical protein